MWLFLATTFVVAQQTTIYTYEQKEFDRALSLFNQKQYVSAKTIFEKIAKESKNQETLSDCHYYIACSAIRTNQSSGTILIERFVQNYPTSNKLNLAYLEGAFYQFEIEDYVKAGSWFGQVNESYIPKQHQEKFFFQRGYVFFKSNDNKEATKYFTKVIDSKDYGSQAKYYLGYIAYKDNNYKEASRLFNLVSGDDKYKGKMSYFQADMNFKEGHFEEAIKLGIAAMEQSTEDEKSELNKIIGESHFNLKQYDKAIPYLKVYKGRDGKWNNTDYYLLGFAYFQQKDYNNALLQFNKIIDGKDTVAQNAYYHLAICYMNLSKKQEALNAFKNVSEMDYDAKIKEDAALNYAKLSYELGNSYVSVPEVLNAFVEKYPASPENELVERLLVDSYISSKSYKDALSMLQKSKSLQKRDVYQKVLFYRGLELFNAHEYTEAVATFRKSSSSGDDKPLEARAIFWEGEIYYQLEDYWSALNSYTKFFKMGSTASPEYRNIHYNIAYCHFKLKQYEKAAEVFKLQTEYPDADRTRMPDVYLRMADCYLMIKKYWAAIEAYNKATETKSDYSEYAYYQKSICYGFVSKNDKKIEGLSTFIKLYPKSEYRDDAMFELANTYVTEQKDESAIQAYDNLIREYPNGLFTSRAILKQGLIYYNADKYPQALVKLKKVVAEFPKSSEAADAVSTARLIYVEQGNVSEYAAWVKTLNFVRVSDADLDNDTFESAEKKYMDRNYKQAIPALETYIEKFPQGINALKANFYMAQASSSSGDEARAIKGYQYVVSEPFSEFSEQSMSKLGAILLKQGQTDKAINVLNRLEDETEIDQNRTFARSNLMKCYFQKQDYTNAAEYAGKVLNDPKATVEARDDAQIIVARSAMKIGDEGKAKLAYSKLLSSAKGDLAAEALYHDSYFKNKEGKYEESNAASQRLAKNYPSYKYYGARGLIIMAKNHYALKDSYQATYILQSVIKNFTEYPDVVTDAKKELTAIKSKESKTNSSVSN